MNDNRTQQLLDKIRKQGVPLSEYVGGKIYYGIKTGLNEAFVIDSATRDRLIAEDPKSAEVIKPFLAGRDIKRYRQPVSDKYLIFARRGIEIAQYPAILKRLEQFREQLEPRPADYTGANWKGRKPGSYKWYEIQDAVDYYAEFEKPKIIYPNICKGPEFTFDMEGLYTNQKCFIISSDDKYLLALLNSQLVNFLFSQLLPKLRGDFYEPGYVYMKDFPIATPEEETVRKITGMVASIFLNQAIDFTAEKIVLESEINRLVYELYGLTEEEITIVEGD